MLTFTEHALQSHQAGTPGGWQVIFQINHEGRQRDLVRLTPYAMWDDEANDTRAMTPQEVTDWVKRRAADLDHAQRKFSAPLVNAARIEWF